MELNINVELNINEYQNNGIELKNDDNNLKDIKVNIEIILIEKNNINSFAAWCVCIIDFCVLLYSIMWVICFFNVVIS